MAVSREIQTLIAKGNLDVLEDRWLLRVEESAEDLDFFVGVARALSGTAEDERARFLLELLDEQLRQRELWPIRRELLRRAAKLLLAPEEIHPAILDTLRNLYADRESLEGLIELVGLPKATHDVPKTWEKVDRLESLISYQVGTAVLMENRGAGRIVEVNMGLQTFKVDFDGFPGLSVGFRAAAKVLQPLPEDHVLRSKLEEPGALAALAGERPAELLRRVLESYDRPLEGAEIRKILDGVLSDAGWKTWWAAARKHPQVVAGSSGRKTYSWLETTGDAVDAVWSAFKSAEPRKQIDLFRRDGGRDAELKRKMEGRLQGTAAGAQAADPGLAFEIYFALERGGEAPENAPWAPRALLAGASPRKVLSGVGDRSLREKGYALLRESRKDWHELFVEILGDESDLRSLGTLAAALRREYPKDFGRFVDGLLAQPHRNPAAFTWLAVTAAEDEELRGRNPLRLFEQILRAPGREELGPWRVRLQNLLESGGTLPRLLDHLDEAQAARAEEAIERAPWLEFYQREQLTNALHLRFPALRQGGELPLYATQASIDAKKIEFKELATKEIPANRKAIEIAREMGDLRENFEYKAARQRHEYLSARAIDLENKLSRVQPIALEGLDVAEIRIGTRATLKGEDGEERTLTILGPWESDPEKDVISYQSEIGQKVLGKKPGESFDLEGKSYEIKKLEACS